jgi:hypothetical protein
MDQETVHARLELLTRAGAIAVVLLYGVGFVIISLHRASYGIVQFELFRAKVLSAGIVFVVFLCLPLIVASRAYGLFGYKVWLPAEPSTGKPYSYARILCDLYFVLSTIGLTFMMRGLLEYYDLPFNKLIHFLIAFLFASLSFGMIRIRFLAAPLKCTVLAVLAISLEHFSYYCRS